MKASVLIVMPRRIDAKGGGITRMVGYLDAALKEAKADIDLSFYPTRMTDAPVLKELSLIWRLFLFICTIGFHHAQIVHLLVAPRGSTGRKAVYAWAAGLCGKKIVLHLHGSGYDEYFRQLSSKKRQVVARFFQNADALIVLGDGWRNFAIKEMTVSPQKIHVVNNGAPDSGLIAARKAHPCRFIFVGSVGTRKGVDVLLKAFSELPASKDWRLVVCGNGEVARFQAMATELGLHPERIQFTGWQDVAGVQNYLIGSDVFVLPSRAENQPISIIEAMALGLPVISTEVGDIPNQVQHGSTGYIVPRGDPLALRDAIQKFIDTPSLAIEMGDRGRERYSREYTVQRNAEKIFEIYKRALGFL